MAQLTVGALFGDDSRYELISQLGSGNFGEVWKARDTHRSTIVALKVLHSAQPDAAWREATRLTELESPHILPVNNAALALDVPFIDTALADGGTLADASNPYGLVPKVAVDLVRQTLRGLHLCHQRRLLHRDVKPENIFLTDTGKAQLGDFGITAVMNSHGEADAYGDCEIAAPEVLDGSPCSVVTDVYSAGVTLFAVLIGRHPIQLADHGNDFDLFRKAVQARLPDIHDLAPHISLSLAKVVRTATALAPSDRFTSVADFDDKLGALRPSTRQIRRIAPHSGHESCWTAEGQSVRSVDVCVLGDGSPRGQTIDVRYSQSRNQLRQYCRQDVRGGRQLAIALRRIFKGIR